MANSDVLSIRIENSIAVVTLGSPARIFSTARCATPCMMR